jgi:DNA-binding transcriptional regulator GbsR (MarR family)
MTKTALKPEALNFIEKIALYYENYGIPRIAGRMFGLFMVSGTPLSAEQIAETLDASLSSISTNVRGLIANGWVEKTSAPGDRTSYYRLSPNAWENVLERRRQSFAPLQRLAEQMRDDLPAEHPARPQLVEMARWTEMLGEHYQEFIQTWRGYTASKKR